ncbi:MAG: hypothetical protein ACYTGN_17640 [Planctomycetota bacterium]
MATKGGRVVALFEVKTDTTRYSVYTAVGQLMLHSTVSTGLPLRVLVIPGHPTASTARALKALGMQTLSYSLRKAGPRFTDLTRISRLLAD